MDFTAIAKQFVEYYYKTFDEDRAKLASLYHEKSMLTFEGSSHYGTVQIIEKLAKLPFQKVNHIVQTIDTQPTNPEKPQDMLLVAVSGSLKVDDGENPIPFSQTFTLIYLGTYFVNNDIFRLNYG